MARIPIPNVALPAQPARVDPDIAVVPALPALPTNLITNPEAKTPHTEFSMTVHYFNMQGVLGLPVSGPPGTPMAIVELTAPWGKKVVMFLARRNGAIPELPSSAPSDPKNEVLESVQVSPAVPSLMPNAIDHQWTVSGVYTYLLRQPPTEKTGYAAGTSPFDATPAKDNVVKEANFTSRSLLQS